jgi:hypothetical protein
VKPAPEIVVEPGATVSAAVRDGSSTDHTDGDPYRADGSADVGSADDNPDQEA